MNMNPVIFKQDQETFLHEKLLPQQREHPIFKAALSSVLKSLENPEFQKFTLDGQPIRITPGIVNIFTMPQFLVFAKGIAKDLNQLGLSEVQR